MKFDALRRVYAEVIMASVLLTRLPMPRVDPKEFQNAARTVWAYPLIGLVVGGLSLLAGKAFLAIGLPAGLAAAVALATTAAVTGAMHEDGLADTADGFWGAFTPENRLSIMKDSQIGTYGTLALIFVTGTRWLCYAVLLAVAPVVLVASAMLSRATMPILMRTLPPARSDGLSRNVGKPATAAVALGFAIALFAAIVLTGSTGAYAALAALAVTIALGLIARRKIGGQTGDVLGAAQQLSELACLFIFLRASL